MRYYNAWIFVDNEFKKGSFTVENGRFAEIVTGDDVREGTDLDGSYVIPGLIDCHTHGNSNADFSDGDYEGVVRMATYLAKNGITAFAPTSMTLPYDVLEQAFKTAVRFQRERPEQAARIGGIHMEGPYFSEKKKGAQNGAYLKNPDAEGFRKLYEASEGLLRIVDVAPELEGAVPFVAAASTLCTVSVAHTDAAYEEAKAAFDAGASHLTHLFNAMPPIHHRKPGTIGAASENASVVAELICDGLHVHESSVRMAFKLFPDRICLISDSLRCCGMPDGDYTLGGQEIRLSGGVARLLDGTMAGAATNLFDGMRNAVRFGVPKEAAIRAATIVPAKELGIDAELGSIETGKLADFVVCDETLRRKAVYIGGVPVRE